MSESELGDLSRRERQIMDLLIRRGRATASDVQGDLPDPPSDSAVRTMLRRLEEKGLVDHSQEGARYVYYATIDRARARASALERTVRTFFGGSPGRTVAALLDRSSADLSDEELDDLALMIERLRKERTS
jgi:predicted transcriptional regulator